MVNIDNCYATIDAKCKATAIRMKREMTAYFQRIRDYKIIPVLDKNGRKVFLTGDFVPKDQVLRFLEDHQDWLDGKDSVHYFSPHTGPEQTSQERKIDPEILQQLQGRVTALENANKRLEADSAYAAELLSENNDLRGSLERLGRERASLLDKLRDAEKARAHDSFHAAAIRHLADYADRVAAAEEILDDQIFESNHVTIERVLERINETSLGPAQTSAEVEAILERFYRSEGAEQNLKQQYEEQDPDRTRLFNTANKVIADIEKTIETFQSYDIPGPVKQEIISHQQKAGEKPRQLAEEYVRDLDAFMEETKAALEECEEMLQDTSQTDMLKEQVDATGCRKIPAYVLLKDGEADYEIRAYMPQTEGRQSTLCDILLSESILGEKVSRIIPKESYEGICKSADDESRLVFYSIRLNKDDTAIEQAIKIATEMQESIFEGYDKTPFRSLGISADVIFNIQVNHPSAELQQEAGQDIIAEAFSEVVSQGLDRVSFREIRTRVTEIAGTSNFSDYRLRSLLGSMIDDGTVKKIGDRGQTRYRS